MDFSRQREVITEANRRQVNPWAPRFTVSKSADSVRNPAILFWACRGIELIFPKALVDIIMKAKVFVTLKPSVLDPQGKAIHQSVGTLGFHSVSDVRQGKYFEINFDSSVSETEARTAAEKMAKDVLANPVVEDFRVEIES